MFPPTIITAPTSEIANKIEKEVDSIDTFGKEILDGAIRNPNGDRYTDVLWIGIGGSGLGPLLMIEALKEYGQGLTFHFLDNIDPIGINQSLNRIQDRLASTLFVIVSKSGGTPEPRIAMQQARYRFESFGGNWAAQSIAITMFDSKLDKQAKSEGWLRTFDMPDWVGGRTSITSAVGLLPAAFIGSDIRKFLDGAAQMDVLTRNMNSLRNPAALLTMAWWKSGEGKGTRDMVILPYRDRLQVFSRYLQQLVMESLGKKHDRNGEKVNQGLSVYGNKGSTDQHAYIQQLRDGLDNYFATFIEVLDDGTGIKPLNNTNPGDYLSGFFQGTRQALTEGGKQSVTLTMNKLDPTTLGAMVALFERAVGLYAELININAYDQPGVEAGKKAASEILLLKEEIIRLLSDGFSRSINDIALSISTNSSESIYFIIRHLAANNNRYVIEGDFSDPKSIKIRIV